MPFPTAAGIAENVVNMMRGIKGRDQCRVSRYVGAGVAMDRADSKPVLRVSNLHVDYGRNPVVHGVSFEVRSAEIAGLLGPRLAGKTTILGSIAGLTSIRSGPIEVHDGSRWIYLAGLPVHAGPGLGIFLVAAEEPVLARFTVEENLGVGAYLRRDKSEIERDMERQFDLVPHTQAPARAVRRHPERRRSAPAIDRARSWDGRGFSFWTSPRAGLQAASWTSYLPSFARLTGIAALPGLIIEKNLKKGMEVTDLIYILRHGTIVYRAPSGASPITNPSKRRSPARLAAVGG